MENKANDGEQGREKAARQERSVAEQEKKPEETRQSKATWLGLGEEWGVVRDVRKMIYSLLTPLERVTVERAHGVKRAFERHEWRVCEWAAERGYLEVLQWAPCKRLSLGRKDLHGCGPGRTFSCVAVGSR